MSTNRFGDMPRWQPYVILFAAIGVVLLVNPVGFIGGFADDARYLEAARCWAAQGTCLPTNHWGGRWPVFAPVGLLIQRFGESRAIVQIWPFICGVSALLLLAHIGQRLFDLRTGITAALLFTFTQAFAFQLLRPNSETVEFIFVLLGIISLLEWRERQRGIVAFLAGLSFGLAFQVRETSIAALIVVAGAMVAFKLRPRPAHLAYAAIGFAIPLAIEFSIYQYATGDFFYRRQLSLSHVRIPSSELPSFVDRSHSPILNPDYIANWRRDIGIHVHWLIDGPLNLLLNPKSGFSLILAPFLLIAGLKWIDRSTRRSAWWLLGIAGAYIAFITYVLAIDPKARIMLGPLALGSLALALILTHLFDHGRKALAIAVFGAVISGGMLMLAADIRMAWADQQATAWSDQFPGEIETNGFTRTKLTLNAKVRAMPDLSANRPLAMIITHGGCRKWVGSRVDPTALSIIGEKQLSLVPDPDASSIYLCLLRYLRPVPAESMKEAPDRHAAREQVAEQ